MTETELKLIAAAASMGESRTPNARIKRACRNGNPERAIWVNRALMYLQCRIHERRADARAARSDAEVRLLR